MGRETKQSLVFKMHVPVLIAAAEEPTSAINLPHCASTGELSLWHKIQGHGKGTSKVDGLEILAGKSLS